MSQSQKPFPYFIKLQTIKSGWSIVYIEESQVIVSKINIVFLPLKIDLSKQTVQTLMKCRIRGFQSTKG